MTIKEEVLEEHFGTKGLRWVDNCPPDEISKEDIYAVIDIATQKTLEKVEKQIKELSRDRGTYYYDLIEAIEKLKEAEK